MRKKNYYDKKKKKNAQAKKGIKCEKNIPLTGTIPRIPVWVWNLVCNLLVWRPVIGKDYPKFNLFTASKEGKRCITMEMHNFLDTVKIVKTSYFVGFS